MALTWVGASGGGLAPRPPAAPPAWRGGASARGGASEPVFGRVSSSGAVVGVAETLDERKPWLQELADRRAEASYASEVTAPLGRHFVAGTVLPPAVAGAVLGVATLRSPPWSVKSGGGDAAGGGEDAGVGRREARRGETAAASAAHERAPAGVRSRAPGAAEDGGTAAALRDPPEGVGTMGGAGENGS